MPFAKELFFICTYIDALPSMPSSIADLRFRFSLILQVQHQNSETNVDFQTQNFGSFQCDESVFKKRKNLELDTLVKQEKCN